MTERTLLLHQHLPELLELELILRRGGPLLRTQVLHEVQLPAMTLPVHAVCLGSEAPDAPAANRSP